MSERLDVLNRDVFVENLVQLAIIPDVIFEPHHYFLTTNML